MTTTSVNTLANNILLPQCPGGAVCKALQDTAYEFCRRTSVWRETLTDTLAAQDQSATLALGAGVDGIIASVVKVTIDDGTDYIKTLPAKVYELDDAGGLTWTDYYASAGDILSADVVVWPTLGCTDYPSELVNRHAQTLIAGATARLQLQKGRPYYDPAGAKLSNDEYENGVRRTILGKSRKGRNFFRNKPVASMLSAMPGTPLMNTRYYEPKTAD